MDPSEQAVLDEGMLRVLCASSPTYTPFFAAPIAAVFGRPAVVGDTARGVSPPANRAFTISGLLSQTIACSVLVARHRGGGMLIRVRRQGKTQ